MTATKPPSLSEIGKHLGISKPRAGQLKQQGMPTTTLRATLLWRQAQPMRRAPTNGKAARMQRKRKGRPRNPAKLSKTGDVLTDILNNAIALAKVAFQSYQDAVLVEGANQAILLSTTQKR